MAVPIRTDPLIKTQKFFTVFHYFSKCIDEETMTLVENMVFQYLKEYREQINRERFILPENQKIELFSNIIKKSIEFFKK